MRTAGAARLRIYTAKAYQLVVAANKRKGLKKRVSALSIWYSGALSPADFQSEQDMRYDKLTTKFQQALADAQSMALRNDNPYIEPAHLLAALLADNDSGASSLLAHAGWQLTA